MTKPRLLVLASTFPASKNDGTPAFVRDLALQESKDFDTLIVVPRVPKTHRLESDAGMRVYRYGYFPRRWEDLADGAILDNLRERPMRWLQVVPLFVAQFLAVRRAVRRFRPDVVHAHWIIPQGIVARLACPRIPLLITTLGGDLYALNSGPLKALKRWVIDGAAAVTVMNSDMLQRVRDLGASVESSQLLPMGADLSTLLRERGNRSPHRAGVLRLAFVGRLVPKKGLSVLLEAIGDLPGIELVVVGDGPLRSELERRATGLPVRFVGQLGRAELARVYRDADVVVAPSVPAESGDRDGLPVATLEAMGMGCAVIASDVPGLGDVVEHGTSGILVAPGDVVALRRAIIDLADDGDSVRRLGEQAARRAEDYSIENVGAAYRSLLASLSKTKRGASA